jgi:hypothetical protein
VNAIDSSSRVGLGPDGDAKRSAERSGAVASRRMDVAALAVALMALGFTIASFWWLHAREGSLEAATPRTYAFAKKVRLRLPLAFFNTGAKSLIVNDLRIVLDDAPERAPFAWITTRTTLRADSEDGFAFATPFAVAGRSAKEVIIEFGDEDEWLPAPASKHRLRLEAVIHPATEWVDVLTFEWWAPPAEELMGPYLTHRNEPA